MTQLGRAQPARGERHERCWTVSVMVLLATLALTGATSLVGGCGGAAKTRAQQAGNLISDVYSQLPMVVGLARPQNAQARVGDWAEWRGESPEPGVGPTKVRWRVLKLTAAEIDVIENVIPEAGVATERHLHLAAYEVDPEYRPQVSSRIVSGPFTERKSILVAGQELTAYRLEFGPGTVVWWAYGVPFGGAVVVGRENGERLSLVAWGAAE